MSILTWHQLKAERRELQAARAADARSRAIVAAMREDEVRHGRGARDAGAEELPWVARALMRVVARLMTVTAYRL